MSTKPIPLDQLPTEAVDAGCDAYWRTHPYVGDMQDASREIRDKITYRIRNILAAAWPGFAKASGAVEWAALEKLFTHPMRDPSYNIYYDVARGGYWFCAKIDATSKPVKERRSDCAATNRNIISAPAPSGLLEILDELERAKSKPEQWFWMYANGTFSSSGPWISHEEAREWASERVVHPSGGPIRKVTNDAGEMRLLRENEPCPEGWS